MNQLAKMVVDVASCEIPDPESAAKRNPNRRGRAGGIKGGVARAKSLTAEQRQKVAAKAAQTRWLDQPLEEPQSE